MEDPAIMIKQWTDREGVQSTYSFDEFLLSHKGKQRKGQTAQILDWCFSAIHLD